MTTTSRVDQLDASTSITGDDLLLVIDGATTAKKITAANTLTYWEAAGTAAALVDDLSGVSNASAARTNLGLGTAAVAASSDFATAAQGAKADTAVQPTVVDAKGDLLVGSAADTLTRLAVGTDNHVLTADSTQPTGLKWAAASGGGSVATDAIFDAKGDLPVGTGADTSSKLAVGSNGQVLRSASAASTGLDWGYPPSLPSPLAAALKGYGLPGRPLVWGGAVAATVGYVFCQPFVCSQDETYDAYDLRGDTGVASTSLDIAIYSCSDWKVGSTMTKVSGTETTGTSLATSGIKTVTLGSTKTLTPGRYVLAFVAYGGASAVNLWYATASLGFSGCRPADGTGAHQEGWVQTTGVSSLAASYTIFNAATYSAVPIVLRRA